MNHQSTEAYQPRPRIPFGRCLLVIFILMLLIIGIVTCLTGCGTTSGIAIANFLESPANQKIIDIAASAGANALLNSTGDKVTPEMRDMLRQAATPAISGAGSGIVWAIGEALRTKQATPDAAKAPALSNTIAVVSGAPPSVSRPVALAVRNLSALVPADKANEAVAVTVQAVAAQRDGLP